MADEDDGYQDDFFDPDASGKFVDYERRDEEADEQHAQKINGKIESLQQRIQDLEQELKTERKTSLEVRKKYDKELQLAWQQQGKVDSTGSVGSSISHEEADSALQKQLEKYKRRCNKLQEKLEIAIFDGSPTTERVPPILEQEFHNFCENKQIFQELVDKRLTIQDCLKILIDQGGGDGDGGKMRRKAPTSSFRPLISTGSSGSSVSSDITAMHMQHLSVTNKLQDRIRNLEKDLNVASTAIEDANNLKNKMFQASERCREEKEKRHIVEGELAASKKKVEMLSDHVEKLVMHLKREAASKVRLSEQLRAVEKDLNQAKEKSELIQRKSSAKDRLILELREGSKVLEDQLRLMDEKYLELRGKLDWARMMSTRKIKKAEKIAAELRVKFAMTGSPVVLDNLPMPSQDSYYGNGPGTEGGGYDAEGYWGDSASQLPPKKGGLRGPHGRSRGGLRNSHSGGDGNSSVGTSVGSMGSAFPRREPSMEVVLQKIADQQGAKAEWTEEKIKKLVQSR